MDKHANWLYPEMPVLSLLRVRPLAQEVFDRLDLDPWSDPRIWIKDLCSSKGVKWPDMEAALRNLPESLSERDWDAAALPMLLDHLVREHEDILGRTIPAIQIALARASAQAPLPNRFSYLAEAWLAFIAELTAHMKEEEVFLFPRLLHYDFCVRHRGWHPDFSTGSVNVFIALHLLGNENRQMDSLTRFVAGWNAAHRTGTPDSRTEQELRGLLEAFQDRLSRHNIIETNNLFPRAKALEKVLYDSAIAGWADPAPVSAPS